MKRLLVGVCILVTSIVAFAEGEETNAFAVNLTATLNSTGQVQMAWTTNGVTTSEISSIDVVAWRLNYGWEDIVASDLSPETTSYDVQLSAGDVVSRNVYSRFAVRYHFWDGTVCDSEVVDLSEKFPSSITIEATGAVVSNGLLKVDWNWRAIYEREIPGQGWGEVEDELPAGWPWDNGGMVELMGGSAASGDVPSAYAQPSEHHLECQLDAFFAAYGGGNPCYVRYCVGLDEYGYPLYVQSNNIDCGLSSRIEMTATAVVSNGIVKLSWTPKAYYYDYTLGQERETSLPDGWPWGQGMLEVMAGCDPAYLNPETPITSSVEIPLDAYQIAMGGVISTYEVRINFGEYYYWDEWSSEIRSYPRYISGMVDLSDKIPSRIEMVTTGVISNGVVTLSWTPKAYYNYTIKDQYGSWMGTETREGPVPEGWPWGQGTVEVYGWQNTGFGGSGSETYLPEEQSVTSSMEIKLDAFAVAMGTACNMYYTQVNFGEEPYWNSYTGEMYSYPRCISGTSVDFRSEIPVSIQMSATGGLTNGVVSLAWEPKAYYPVYDEYGNWYGSETREGPLPEGWPWEQGTVEVHGWKGMAGEMGGENCLDIGKPVVSSLDIQLDAYEVAMGTACNRYEVSVVFGREWYWDEWAGEMHSYSKAVVSIPSVNIRSQIPAYIQTDTTGVLSNGIVNLSWEPKAYYPVVDEYGNWYGSETQEGPVPEGWPWGQCDKLVVTGSGVYNCDYSNPTEYRLELDDVTLTSCEISLNAYDVATGHSPRFYDVHYAFGMGMDGYDRRVFGGCVDFCDQIPAYMQLEATASASKGTVKANWSLTSQFYTQSGDEERTNFVPEGWPWGQPLVVQMMGNESLASATVDGASGTLSGTLEYPGQEWLSLELGLDEDPYSRLTYSLNIPSQPVIDDDPGATVIGDAESGYTITPSADKTAVEVTIPDGVSPEMVTVEIGTDVETIKANGANVKIVKGGNDITSYLDIPSADASGTIDLTQVAVKEEIVKETLDPESGAEIELNAESPTLTTAATKPGLTYTLNEGTDLLDMSSGDSKLGDGQPWTPNITVKGGTSGFYSIQVTK